MAPFMSSHWSFMRWITVPYTLNGSRRDHRMLDILYLYKFHSEQQQQRNQMKFLSFLMIVHETSSTSPCCAILAASQNLDKNSNIQMDRRKHHTQKKREGNGEVRWIERAKEQKNTNDGKKKISLPRENEVNFESK